MSTIELYNAGISTCSQRVRFVLAYKELGYTDTRIRLEQGEHLTPEYLAVNPNGLVPTLVHDGKAILDSSVINEYLEEVFPDISLIPKPPYERAQMRSWIQYIDEVTTPAIRYPSFQKFFGGGLRAMSPEQRQSFANRLPLRKHFALEIGAEGFPQIKLDAAMERIEQSLQRMEVSLGKTQWIAHDELTLADVAMMPSIVRLEDLGLASLWADMPCVANWYTRLQALPAFAQAYSSGSRLGACKN
jgi:glutathione S-transferase